MVETLIHREVWTHLIKKIEKRMTDSPAMMRMMIMKHRYGLCSLCNPSHPHIGLALSIFLDLCYILIYALQLKQIQLDMETLCEDK